tara:strand:+ start:410 stop:691 length:282 start_codon:yes stop_codon:yes gene_type:complete
MARDRYAEKARNITRVNGQDVGFPVRDSNSEHAHRRGHYQDVRDVAKEARLFDDAAFEYEEKTGKAFYIKQPTIKRIKQLVRAKRNQSPRINE